MKVMLVSSEIINNKSNNKNGMSSTCYSSLVAKPKVSRRATPRAFGPAGLLPAAGP